MGNNLVECWRWNGIIIDDDEIKERDGAFG